MDAIDIYPAKHFVTSQEKLEVAIADIETELAERCDWLQERGKLVEAQRLLERTRYDMESLREQGLLLRHRELLLPPGAATPHRQRYRRSLRLAALDSPGLLPGRLPSVYRRVAHGRSQIRGMFHGDISRKRTLVDYGFRLPSALDNRPLNFDEFLAHVRQVIYVSLRPAPGSMSTASRSSSRLSAPPASSTRRRGPAHRGSGRRPAGRDSGARRTW